MQVDFTLSEINASRFGTFSKSIFSHLTPVSFSGFLIPFKSSVKRGSTRAWIATRLERAAAASSRTDLLASVKALRNVVCS